MEGRPSLGSPHEAAKCIRNFAATHDRGPPRVSGSGSCGPSVLTRLPRINSLQRPQDLAPRPKIQGSWKPLPLQCIRGSAIFDNAREGLAVRQIGLMQGKGAINS